jgi:hypothetical protein
MVETTVRDEFAQALDEAQRSHQPMGRMVMNRWTLLSLWALRFYVVIMLGLIALKFLQLAAG